MSEAAGVVSIASARARERVLYRLRNPVMITTRVCGFYHPDDKAALERLAAEDLARCWLGVGRDAGLLLGRLELQRPGGASAAPAQPGGGS